MLPCPQTYGALPSETASTSPTLCQPESQSSREKVESSAPQTSSRRTRFRIPRFWTGWEWEFAAFALALAAPIIMFATLYPNNGRPLPQWPFKVSINSVLSVYALVFKAAIGFILTSCIGQLQWTWFSETRLLTDMLHFDNATRGAAGALSLIWRQRLRQPLTAFGCVIMVLAVAIDPFIQQLVRPVDCGVAVSGDHATATLPRANVFEYKGYDLNTNNHTLINDGIPTGGMDRAIDDALYSAFFFPGQDPPWQCSTGNCTFAGTYGTIGFCSSCQDSSGDVIINSTCSPPDSSHASRHPTSGADCPANSSFAVESNFTVSEWYNPGTKMSLSSNAIMDAADVADAISELEHSDTRNLLFRFLIGATASADGRTDWTTSDNSTCNPSDSRRSWACQGYGAATCSLKPCVHIYNATISAGVLKENLIASSSDTAWGTIYTPDGVPFYLALIDTHCSAGLQTSSNRASSEGSRWLPYDFSLTETDVERGDHGQMIAFHLPDEVKSLLNSGCLYLMDPESIMFSVQQALTGTVQADASVISSSGTLTTGTSTILTIMSFRGPDIIQIIYNWGHTDLERVQEIFANVSSSLTTYIRAHGGSHLLPGSVNFSRNVQGSMYRYATCLQVQWPWIAFPACLAVSTALFFLTVLVATKRRGTSVWKVSPLAWVLRADGLGSEQYSSSTKVCEDMRERSRHIAVRILDEDRDGPRIRLSDIKDPNLL